MNTTINIFLLQSIIENGSTLEPKLYVPNQTTLDAITEGRRIATEPSVKGYTNLNDLITALEE